MCNGAALNLVKKVLFSPLSAPPAYKTNRAALSHFLQEGQQVKVKIINIDQQGRINLSIKKAQPQEPRQQHERSDRGFAPRQPRFQQRREGAPRGRAQQAPKDPSTMTFEDKLKAFMTDSESRQADVRHATDRKNGSRRRR